MTAVATPGDGNLLPGEVDAAVALADAARSAQTRVRAILDDDGTERPGLTAEWTRAAALRDIAENLTDYLTHMDGLPAQARGDAADVAVIVAAAARRLLAAEAR